MTEQKKSRALILLSGGEKVASFTWRGAWPVSGQTITLPNRANTFNDAAYNLRGKKIKLGSRITARDTANDKTEWRAYRVTLVEAT